MIGVSVGALRNGPLCPQAAEFYKLGGPNGEVMRLVIVVRVSGIMH